MDDVAYEEDHDHNGGDVGHPFVTTNRIPYTLKTQELTLMERVTMIMITVKLKILSYLH